MRLAPFSLEVWPPIAALNFGANLSAEHPPTWKWFVRVALAPEDPAASSVIAMLLQSGDTRLLALEGDIPTFSPRAFLDLLAGA